MQTYGLKPNDQVDNWEAKRIVERMVQEDEKTKSGASAFARGESS
jgi:hypothetical protein